MTPIHDATIEAAVLGGILNDANAQWIITEIREEHFFDPLHAGIFRTCHELYTKGETINTLSVAMKMRTAGLITNPAQVAKIAAEHFSSASINYNAKILYQLFGIRKLAMLGQTLQAKATDKADPFHLANEVQTEIDAFVNNISRDPVKIGKMVTTEIQRIGNRSANGEAMVISTGWPDLDHLCNGMTPGELWILAGRPGMGKTAMAVAILQAHCRAGGSGLMFSLEMENSALAQRIISGDTGIPAYQLKRGELKDEEIRSMLNYTDTVDALNIWFEDTPHTTIEKIRARVKTMKQKHGITCIVCDYLGLVTPSNIKEIREQQVAHISKTAKQIAKECGVTFIMLAQLNREVEKRGDKKPMLSDLRESGAIEQDADLILFPFRPAYYEQGGEVRAKTEEEAAELHIGKNRNGIANVVIPCTFVPGLASYKLRASTMQF